MIFFDLDFAKIYYKVSWTFLFKAMQRLGIHERFIGWTRMFFKNSNAKVTSNKSNGKEFMVEKGVRQGCPLAPNVFLIMEEILNP